MSTTSQSTRLEQVILIPSTPEKVFQVLTDPNNISRYAGGIEGAEVLEKPLADGYAGALLQLVTKGGNLLRAQVVRADHDCIEVLDERGVRARWEISQAADGMVRLRNVIEGPLPIEKLNALRYDSDVKFQALQRIFDETEPKAGAG